jgi:colanic acid/amylovoran biosynthesis glycosyltransferase
LPIDVVGHVLVYRDRLGVRSEVQFLRRLYSGFNRLLPVWLGCHVEANVDALGAPALQIGRDGALGALDRALFKQCGLVPSRPDLRALKPRLIHAHFGRGGALALPLARALRLPLAVTFHGGDATKETHYRRRAIPTIYQRRLLALQREAALFHCVSDHIRDVLADRGFPPEKLRTIRLGIEPDPLVAPHPGGEKPYLLFVGRFVEKKGATHLLDALRLLRNSSDAPRLIMIGDGPLDEQLRRAAASLPEVSFPGWQAPAEVRARMRDALALIVPSTTAATGDEEGLPTVVLEAMAQGTPVIGSRHSGIVEAVTHDADGLLVPPGDPQALAEAIGRLIHNEALRRRLGMAARRTVSERFDARTQSHRLEEALLSLAELR